MRDQHQACIVAIVLCNDMEASTAFYRRLGLDVQSDHGPYRILSNGNGWRLHLSAEAPEGWVIPNRNPIGIYLYWEDVDALASRVADLALGMPEHKPWGMYEFALSDPDGRWCGSAGRATRVPEGTPEMVSNAAVMRRNDLTAIPRFVGTISVYISTCAMRRDG